MLEWSWDGVAYRLGKVFSIEEYSDGTWRKADTEKAIKAAISSGSRDGYEDGRRDTLDECIDAINSEPLLPEKEPSEYAIYSNEIYRSYASYLAFVGMLVGCAADTRENILNKIKSL